MKQRTGICTWSLNNEVEPVFQCLGKAGLHRLHLDVAAADRFRGPAAERDIRISCTMVSFPQEDYSTLESIRQTGGIVPDDCWEQNRRIVKEAVAVTAELGVEYLSFHAGFIDHEDSDGFLRFGRRMSELADAAAERGVMLLMETGQETAEELRAFLDMVEHPALGVNFDPANMILYGKGRPGEAVQVLSPWIRHVHIKDAVASAVPGEWGTEVPWGDGEVDAGFFQALERIGYSGAFAIEREAGEARMDDMVQAADGLEVKHGR